MSKKQLFLTLVIIAIVIVFITLRESLHVPNRLSLKLRIPGISPQINGTVAVSTKNVSLPPGLAQYRNIVDAARRVSLHNRTVLVTVINNAYLPFTYSWLCNTKTMNIHNSILIITTDLASKTKLQTDWPDVTVVAMNLSQLNGAQTFGHAGYLRIMVKRTDIIMALLHAGIEVFLFEVDCVWFANPTPEMQETKGYDILINPVSGDGKLTSGGFMYLFPTAKTKAVWQKVNDLMKDLDRKMSNKKNSASQGAGNDQMFFSALINEKYAGVVVKELPLTIYPDGLWYKQKDKTTSKIKIINNNFVMGNSAKISRAKRWGHWFLLNNMACDMERVNKTVRL